MYFRLQNVHHLEHWYLYFLYREAGKIVRKFVCCRDALILELFCACMYFFTFERITTEERKRRRAFAAAAVAWTLLPALLALEHGCLASASSCPASDDALCDANSFFFSFLFFFLTLPRSARRRQAGPLEIREFMGPYWMNWAPRGRPPTPASVRHWQEFRMPVFASLLLLLLAAAATSAAKPGFCLLARAQRSCKIYRVFSAGILACVPRALRSWRTAASYRRLGA